MFRASEEALRRYYSVKECKQHGTPNVCSAPEAEIDFKYTDQHSQGLNIDKNEL